MDLRRDGIPVSHLLLQIKAREVAAANGVPTQKFKASMLWVEGFKRRWNLTMRAKSRSGKANEAQGQQALEAFSLRIQETIRNNNVQKLFNADQTAVNFEMLPKKTLTSKGDKTVWIMAAGKEKERASVMLLADSSGIKYPPFIVMKSSKSNVPQKVQENLKERNGFGKSVWKDIEWLLENLPSHFFGNPTAWWNSGITLRFLNPAEIAVVEAFWSVVAKFSPEERARLLQFATGTSRVQGFKALTSTDGRVRRFTIQMVQRRPPPTGLMPKGHTCLNRIDLPLYSNKEELAKYLTLVINMESTGFWLE
ncbi:hypothetical protein Ae201684_019112 [Aphanomyces euteiches]|uniref:HECT-type E3 ubiquitin transferase n=1 Tax=Aphanomyces euteiches TaxID=100861 RepID=A0A6G0W3F0_9STRA|nr:hypothetical protein Ae201684_019112 [Aphanomyces euteiches]